jgi:hypothetical protein
MLQLTSTGAVVDLIAHARNIAAEAYTLHGPVLFALEAAARRGANVRVRLEGRPFDDPKGKLAAENARLAGELKACGAKATLAHPLHAKALDLDGALYLDEKNWQRNDLVLRENDAAKALDVATIKHDALAREARLLGDSGRGDDAVVESESFGCCNAVYAALRELARAGASPRLLVAQRELRGNEREAEVLEKLANDGVRVRVCKQRILIDTHKKWPNYGEKERIPESARLGLGSLRRFLRKARGHNSAPTRLGKGRGKASELALAGCPNLLWRCQR